MTELFADVSDEIKGVAETSWQIALHKSNAAEAAEFLSDIIAYHTLLGRPDKEIAFLDFYFKMQMEMMNDDDTSTER